MQTGNVKIMAVAAVAIIICLLFSWVYLDDDPVEMRYAEVGDYMVLDCVELHPDGSETSYELTITVVEEDEAGNQTVQYAYTDGYYYDVCDGNFVSNNMGEIVGTETVDSPYFGEVECNIYLQPDGSLVWNPVGSNAFVMDRNVVDGITITRMVTETSLFGDTLEFGHSVEEDTVEVGDYYAYEVYVYDDKIILTFNYQDGTETITLDDINGSDLEAGSPPKRYVERLVFAWKQAFSLFNDEIGISVPAQALPKGAFRVNAPLFCVPSWD